MTYLGKQWKCILIPSHSFHSLLIFFKCLSCFESETLDTELHSFNQENKQKASLHVKLFLIKYTWKVGQAEQEQSTLIPK